VDGTLILGLAAGYHYGDVRPFLVSLEETGYAGDLVLFVSETTRDLERMARHRVSLIPFKRSHDLKAVPYNALRYFLYQEYLVTDTKHDQILITDVRDVLFQMNPFSFAWPVGINAALEDHAATVGGCPFNAHWVQGALGADALSAIGHCPVSCSGTTLADRPSMLAYLQQMTTKLLPAPTDKGMAGYDQGVHNHLIHTHCLRNLTLHDNTGPIMTLAQTKGEPQMDAEGFVLNAAGNRPYLVHQYDRKPRLFKNIQKRYAPLKAQ